jgi:hypothetical protein
MLNACHWDKRRHVCSIDRTRRYGSALNNDSDDERPEKMRMVLDARAGCRLEWNKQKPRHTIRISCCNGPPFLYMFLTFLWALGLASTLSFGNCAVP